MILKAKEWVFTNNESAGEIFITEKCQGHINFDKV